MSTVNPIAGNAGFTLVNNNNLNPQLVQSALLAGNLQAMMVAKGSAVLTTASGNFAVQNNGVTLILPDNAIVVRVSLVGDGTLETASTSTLALGLAASSGGVVVNGFHSAVTPGATQVGVLCPLVTQVVGQTNNYVSVTVGTAGAAVGGNLNVSILYYLC